jgi:hypothetical protein
MRLSLGGWPPVASHATCLLAGLALAHLTAGQSAESPRFSPQVLIFALRGKPHLMDDSGKDLRPGIKLILIQRLNNNSCRLHDTSLDVLAVEPNLALALPLRDPQLSSIVSFLRKKIGQKSSSESNRLDRGNPFLEIASRAQHMPLCKPSPTVIYD